MDFTLKMLAVAIGGAFGAVTRYVFNLIFAEFFVPFPFATFFINISGSFLIGFLVTLFGEKIAVGEFVRLALIAGFLGAYTTFSTFEFETFTLIREKNLVTAFIYVAGSFAVGLIGVFIGVWLAQKI